MAFEHKGHHHHIDGLVHQAMVGDVAFSGSALGATGFAGTKGQSRQLEGFELRINPAIPGVSLEYMCHAADVGDMAWQSEGKYQGSRGAGRRMEGIAVRLTGPNAAHWEVGYQVHMADRGDGPVVFNGEYAGTRGESRRIEAIRIFIQAAPQVSGLVHLANRGDVAFAHSSFAGTKGEKRAVEAFTLAITPARDDLGIEYMAHQANVGDRAWVSNGSLQGSRGESRQLEGFAVRLTGPSASRYTVAYTGHLADRGDTAVHENGAYCGTRGESRRLEGIHVWIRRN
jgi:uncharacterized protein YjdB